MELTDHQDLRARLERLANAHPTVGLAVGVVRDNQTAEFVGRGFADVESGRLMRPKTDRRPPGSRDCGGCRRDRFPCRLVFEPRFECGRQRRPDQIAYAYAGGMGLTTTVDATSVADLDLLVAVRPDWPALTAELEARGVAS